MPISDDLSAAAGEYAEGLGNMSDCARVAFAAGARWAFEQAARIADDAKGNWKDCGCEVCKTCTKIAAALRARAAGSEGKG